MTELISDVWYPTFLDAVVTSTILLAAAFCCLAVSRYRSAAQRHSMAAIALFALFLLPVLSKTAPAGWGLRAPARWKDTISNSPAYAASGRSHTATAIPGKVNVSDSKSSDSSLPAVQASTAGSRQTLSPTLPAHTIETLQQVFIILWLTAAVILLFRQAAGLFGLWMLARRGGKPAPNEFRDRIRSLPDGAVVTDRVKLIIDTGNGRAVPVTWGALRPVLLLPGDIEFWPDGRFRAVMIHEIEHIRRRDWLSQTFAQTACTLYCFHPLAWYLYRRLKVEAEFACDDAVIRLSGLPNGEYAQRLLEVVSLLKSSRETPAAIGIFGRYNVTRRVEAILARERCRDHMTRKAAFTYIAVATLVLCVAVALRPAAAREARRAQIALSQSTLDQMSFPDRGPSGKTITLGSGVGVELIAVGVAPTANGSNWWTTDGDVLPEPPARVRNQFHLQSIGPGDKYVVRTLCFRLHSAVNTDASTTGYVVDPTHHLDSDLYLHGRDIPINDAHLLPLQSAVADIDLKLPPSEKMITYRFGIASGKWQTVKSVSKDDVIPQGSTFLPASAGGFDPRLELSPTLSLVFRDSAGGYRTQPLLSSPLPLGDEARRVIAFDREGREVPLGDDQTGYSTQGLDITGEKLAQIKEFRIQTRPYEWAEFKGVAVQPKAAILPFVATPATLPQYKHTFSCGLTMEIPAVTLPKHGGRFWRPDGKLVPGPLKEYATTIDPAWGPELPLVLYRISGRTATSFTTAFEFLPAVWNEEGVRHSSHEGRLGGNPSGGTNQSWPGLFVAYYQRNMPSEMTIRYGVASLPWKTVGSVIMPQDIQHNASIPDFRTYRKFGEDLSIDLNGRVAFKFATASGQPQIQYFLPAGAEIGNDARRILAIDKQGRETTVYCLNEGHKRGGDQILLSFHNSGSLVGRNQFDLSSIKEFRLQTRPYDWAEFKHIQLAPKGDQ